MLDKLFVLSQYVTPQRTVSHLAGRLADSTGSPALKNRVINWFIGRYGVNMSEAAESDPTAYPSFNAFFTRELKPGARTITPGDDVFVSPVDGAISQLGQVSNDRVFQAKGQSFGLTELLGGDESSATPFRQVNSQRFTCHPRTITAFTCPWRARSVKWCMFRATCFL